MSNIIFQLGLWSLVGLASGAVVSSAEAFGFQSIWRLFEVKNLPVDAATNRNSLDTLPGESLRHLLVPPKTRKRRQARIRKYKGVKYYTYIVDPNTSDIALYYDDERRQRYQTIGNLNKELKAASKELLFATNGGIFQVDGSPLGLYIEDGRQRKAVNLKRGSGNFYLHPNGVFYINEWGFPNILESVEFMNNFGENPQHVLYAIQSGPLLLNKNRINGKFTPNSPNRKIRSGVGWSVTDPKSGMGRMVFVLSDSPVNFYDFARFFQEKLNCTRAL